MLQKSSSLFSLLPFFFFPFFLFSLSFLLFVFFLSSSSCSQKPFPVLSSTLPCSHEPLPFFFLFFILLSNSSSSSTSSSFNLSFRSSPARKNIADSLLFSFPAQSVEETAVSRWVAFRKERERWVAKKLDLWISYTRRRFQWERTSGAANGGAEPSICKLSWKELNQEMQAPSFIPG